MTPAPTTISFFGGWVERSAPVEETTFFSSISTPGRRATSEPVAMTMALVSTRRLAGRALDHDLAGRGDERLALQPVDLVLLEQERDAVDVGGDRVVLVLHHGGHVELAARATFTPSGGHAVAGLLEHLGGVEQRLGRDAADVEAGAAERLALLDDGDFHAELRRADRADIAAGPGADDDEIVGHVDEPAFDKEETDWRSIA